MQDHMAGCNRWVGGRRRSKQEVIITLPAAALHLLTTWTDWKKFSNKLNINRCSSPHAQAHALVLYHMPQLVLFYLFFRELFLGLQKEEIYIYIYSLRWAIELRMGKSISLQNRRTQVQNKCAYVGGVWLCMYMRSWRSACMCLLVIESGCISVWGKLWQPGVFVLKFRQGSRWLLSVWRSKLVT